MSEALLVRHCSPTLAGIKTGNLFSCPCASRTDLTKELSQLNKKLVPKGIRVLPLRVRRGRALIYVYRPHALECDLADQRARVLLLKYGYTPENPNCCVVHLIRRLCAEEEFPHRLSPIGTQCGPMGLNAAYGEETRRRFKSFCDGSFYIPMQKNNTVSIRMWSFMRIYQRIQL